MQLEPALARPVDIPPDLRAGLHSGLALMAFLAGDGESAGLPPAGAPDSSGPDSGQGDVGRLTQAGKSNQEDLMD